ncbi:MAG TPA: hypothetical protein VK814_14550 [Acidobacteriaceae bacterium]|nr:hypothetical protein [Acidobacteriaceae bacterium]
MAEERSGFWKHVGWRMVMVALLFPTLRFGGQSTMVSANPPTPLQVVNAMIAHEDDNSAHKDTYEFLSKERSDRTGGRVWTERVVETSFGRVRFLLAVDGTPLNAEQEGAERGRLAVIVADPQAFLAKERAQKDDEAQARKLLDLLPKAFVFDNVRLKDGVWTMDIHPNPEYSPHGIEERVLSAMTGTVVIDATQERLMHVDGRLPQDVSIGFGLVATVKAGSHFSSDRADEDGHWRTLHVLTDVNGKAVLFKSVGKHTEVTRSEFHYLQPGMTVAQAVALAECPARTAGDAMSSCGVGSQ